MRRLRDQVAPADATGAVLHPVITGVDPVCDQVSLAAARSFLRADTRGEVAALLREAVTALGGTVVPAWEAHHDALPVDVSLGVGDPSLAVGLDEPSDTRLRAALPALVMDALEAAARRDQHAHEAWRASVDELTGVASRREIMPRVRATRPGDVVCVLDLDHLKEINDATGHVGGDHALRGFGQVLRAGLRPGDFVGRYGGDEFVVIMVQTRLPVAVQRVRGIARRWDDGRTNGFTFSGGAARVDERGGSAAMDAADQALYRSKQNGRGRVEVASATCWRTGAER